MARNSQRMSLRLHNKRRPMDNYAFSGSHTIKRSTLFTVKYIKFLCFFFWKEEFWTTIRVAVTFGGSYMYFRNSTLLHLESDHELYDKACDF